MESVALKYMFVQRQPSQLEAIFYGELAKLNTDKLLVVFLNKTANRRRDIDPELGLVPELPDLNVGYPHEWIESGIKGLFKLMKRIIDLRPMCVVLQDQRWSEKILLALFCRLAGIQVAMRSDKNYISAGARFGFPLWVERLLVRRLFNVLCPISELTTEYYAWTRNREAWLFPYSTNRSKFETTPASTTVRRAIRRQCEIPDEAFVFLAVVKFIERENPRGLIDAFKEVVAAHPESWLVVVGSGPQFDEIRQHAVDASIVHIVFVGYVPYAKLEQYFFASDVFMHLAKSEPWGISPQDALVAGMGLITSDKVGSGICHLKNELSRFVVPINDKNTVTERMVELISNRGQENLFKPAKDRVMNGFTADSLAIQWAARREVLGDPPCNAASPV